MWWKGKAEVSFRFAIRTMQPNIAGNTAENPKSSPPKKTTIINVLRDTWNLLESLYFSIFLFIVISLASLIGAVIPQKADMVIYYQAYGPATGELFRLLGFQDVYGSTWFTVLLGILCLSTFACTLRRFRVLRAAIKKPVVIISDSFYENASCHFEKTLNQNSIQIQEIIERQFIQLKLGSNYTKQTDGNRIGYFSEKQRINRYGNLMAHISIVLILLGGFIGKTIFPWSMDMTLPVKEGESVVIPGTDYQVHLIKYEETYYPGTQQPSDFRSYLRVSKGTKIKCEYPVWINHPLRIGGVGIFQSARQETEEWKSLEITIQDAGHVGNHTTVMIYSYSQATVSMPMKTIRIKPDDADLYAIVIEEITGNQVTGRTTLNLMGMNPESKLPVKYQYSIQSVQPRMISIFQVVKDPGVPLVFAGFALLTLGMILALGLEYRRYWIVIIPQGDQSTIRFIGESSRKLSNMHKGYERLIRTLES